MTRLALAGLCVFAAAATLATGCPSPSAPPVVSGKVHHVVVCWLKEGGNEAARTRLLEASREFESIPGVTRVAAGTMLPSERAVVDSTFDVAIVISFSSRSALTDYLAHPIHKQAVKEVLERQSV